MHPLLKEAGSSGSSEGIGDGWLHVSGAQIENRAIYSVNIESLPKTFSMSMEANPKMASTEETLENTVAYTVWILIRISQTILAHGLLAVCGVC